MYRFGIGIWIGAGVYSAINMLMNLKGVAQSNILNYNYIITGVAVIGLILNNDTVMLCPNRFLG